MITPPLKEYSRDHFVNREAEVSLVGGLARKLSEGGRQPGQPHVITIRGQRGKGKTWLALHLKRTVLPEIPGAIPLLISLVSTFDPNYKPHGGAEQKGERFLSLDMSPIDPDIFCVDILKWVAENLGTTTAERADSSELSNWMIRDIKQKLSHKVIVLILDSVFETDWPYLKKLEEYLLVPLATLPNTLLVMTGRGGPYPWISPYLRMAEERDLPPFKDAETQEQLKLQMPEVNLSGKALKALIQISGGNPLVNVLVANASDKKEALDETANLLLDIKSTKYKPEIREYFEALSVLDGFDEEEIAPMLSALHEDDKIENEWTDEKKREVKEKMLKTHLVRWEDDKYVMDDSIRRVLDEYLKLNEGSEKWVRLHNRANKLYEDWAKKYTKHSKFFKLKANAHSDALKKSGLTVKK